MRRLKKLIGLPVVELSTGKSLGPVQDVLVDLKANGVVALILKRTSLLSDGRALCVQQVRSFGDDAITVGSREDLKTLHAVQQEYPDAAPSEELLGRHVLTHEGRLLGSLEDLQLSLPEGLVTRYVLSEGLWHDLMNGRVSMPVPQQALFQEDNIIVGLTDETDAKAVKADQLRMGINPPDSN